MKGNSRETHINIFLILILFMSGCSSFSNMTNRKNLMTSKGSKKVKMVSQEQYNQLLRKYETLLNKSKPENNKEKEVVADTKAVDPSKIVSDISIKGDSVELAETVSVFDKSEDIIGNSKSPRISKNKGSYIIPSKKNMAFINNEISLLKKANQYIRIKKYNKAMTILKDLENSRVKQVMVRAKYLIGEMLFEKERYDLALQMFEEIINNYAFSSVILKSLGKLVVCSERLNLVKRKNQYYSILHDFFEG